MDFTLFDEFITLQSLLKELGIIQSGGAIKAFLADSTVLVNGEEESRRGKKLRLGDQVLLTEQGISIQIVAPSAKEKAEHQAELEEKERVAALVKAMNKDIKAKKPKQNPKKQAKSKQKKAPVRFPGT